MNGNKKPYAYYVRIVHNSRVNEFRQNLNSSHHIIPVGIELPEVGSESDGEDSIEEHISRQTPKDWLLFIENVNLHDALVHLSPDELELLFRINFQRYSQKELSELMGITHQSLNGRLKTIYKKIKKYF